jgi:tRNA threonylcarbamoyladenosine biosynthesis protein TsaE
MSSFPHESRFVSNSEAETVSFGQRLARALSPGDVIALQGQLGAGKTRLVQAIAAELGCSRAFVVSPTFTLIHEYDGLLPVYHVDAYRLKDSDEFLDMGGSELIHGDGVCLIEWADRIGDLLPQDHLRVEIEVTGEQSRVFHCRASGPLSGKIIASL